MRGVLAKSETRSAEGGSAFASEEGLGSSAILTNYCRTKPRAPSVSSVLFDWLAPARLALWANLRLLYLKGPAFSIVVKFCCARFEQIPCAFVQTDRQENTNSS